MNRKKHLRVASIIVILLVALGVGFGCATFQPEQQEAVERMAARTAGYLVAKEEPELAAEILPYIETYLAAPTLQAAVIQEGIVYLEGKIKDPLVVANVRDVVEMIKIPEEPLFDETKLRQAIFGFKEGLLMAIART